MQRAFVFSSAFLALLFAPALSRASAPAAAPSDTIVMRLPNKATLTLTVRNTAELRQLKNYHLDSLTSRLATYIVQAEKAAQASSTDQVTLQFFPDKDQPGKNLPEQIRITTRKKSPDASRVDVVLNKAFGVEVTTDEDGNKTFKAGDEKTKAARQAHRDSVRIKERTAKRHTSDLVLDLGLNALVNTKPYLSQNGQLASIELRPEGSRYVNIGIMHSFRLGGKRSPMWLNIGPEFAVNNYMLSGNRRWVDENGRTGVILNREGKQYEKTKLSSVSANLPLMLQMKLRDSHGRGTFSLAGGSFVGYRIKSWTKIKYTEDGSTVKEKDKGNYNLEDVQYGVQGSVGYRGLTLFAKYNMNDLFKAGVGPQAQVVSFGLRIFGD